MKTIALLFALPLIAGCTPEIRQEYENAFNLEIKTTKSYEVADDAECQRQGAQPGTDFYQLCRKRLADKHIAEAEDIDRRRIQLVR